MQDIPAYSWQQQSIYTDDQWIDHLAFTSTWTSVFWDSLEGPQERIQFRNFQDFAPYRPTNEDNSSTAEWQISCVNKFGTKIILVPKLVPKLFFFSLLRGSSYLQTASNTNISMIKIKWLVEAKWIKDAQPPSFR